MKWLNEMVSTGGVNILKIGGFYEYLRHFNEYKPKYDGL